MTQLDGRLVVAGICCLVGGVLLLASVDWHITAGLASLVVATALLKAAKR